jgi:NAD(P)-dependent dehydrogenase (short-subunit alcohol dehydrogenase family)
MPNEVLRVFKNATTIITGGASGIGRALAEELAGRGAEVVLVDLQIELAEEVVAGIRAGGGEATASETDVRDFSAVDRLVRETAQRTGRLDYMFNNAGIAIGGDISLHGIEDWDLIVNTNLRGVINGIQAAYPIMREQGFGHIINIASMAGLFPSPGLASYSTTKHAVVGLSTSLRIEAAPAGVRVSVLCPGVIRTPILEGGKYGKDLIGMSAEQKRRMWERFRPMPAPVFASKALGAIARNRSIIIIPWYWKLSWWTQRLFPSAATLLAQKLYRDWFKQLND